MTMSHGVEGGGGGGVMSAKMVGKMLKSPVDETMWFLLLRVNCADPISTK